MGERRVRVRVFFSAKEEERMDGLAEAVNDMHITDLSAKKNRIQNRIQVSNTKKPLFFYVNLAKVPLPSPSLLFLGFFSHKFVSFLLYAYGSSKYIHAVFACVVYSWFAILPLQKYMQLNNEVELSGLGMGIVIFLYPSIFVPVGEL